MLTEKGPGRMDELVVSREIAAPAEAVWPACSEPGYLGQWWGPDGFSRPGAVIELREGGSAVVGVRAPTEIGSGDSSSPWSFTRIGPKRRIELMHDLCDATGTPVDPPSVGMPSDSPRAQRHVIESDTRGGSTLVTVTVCGWPEGQTREFPRIGMGQCLVELDRVPRSGTERTGRDADCR